MKRNVLFGLLVVFLMVGSVMVIAEETVTEETCMGFWGKLGCILWGDPALKDKANEAFATGQGIRDAPADEPEPVVEPRVEPEPRTELVEPKVATIEDQAEEENVMLPATRDEKNIIMVAEEEVTCVESDKGVDYNSKGGAKGVKEGTDNFGNYEDTCGEKSGDSGKESGFYIAETYCSSSDNQVNTQWYKCPLGCYDGKCIPVLPDMSCVDTDGGSDYYVKGTVRGINDVTLGGKTSATDKCEGNQLKEYICGKHKGIGYLETVALDKFDCEFGCEDGACLKTVQQRSVVDEVAEENVMLPATRDETVREVEEVWVREVVPGDVVGGETRCADGLDDDGDGNVDCFDGDCSGVDVCKLKEDGKVCCLYHDLKYGIYVENFNSAVDCHYPESYDFGVNTVGRFSVINKDVCKTGTKDFSYTYKYVGDQTEICSDPDGKDYNLKSYSSGLNSYSGEMMNYVDTCVDAAEKGHSTKESKYLNEWVCDGDIIIEDELECEFGCFDGRCLEEGEEVEEEVVEEDILEEVFETDITEEGAEPYALGCSGCESDGKCLPFGTRKVVKGIDSFCDLEERWAAQSSLDASCQNDYECLTNECSNGVCSDLAKELEETQNLLQEVLDYVKQFFGVEEETFIIEENFGIIEYVGTEFDEKNSVPFNILNNHGEAYGGYYTKGVLAIVQDHDKDVNEKIFIEELLDQASGMKVGDVTEFDQHIYCSGGAEEENMFFCAWLSEDKVVALVVENFEEVKSLQDMEESFMENFLPAYLAKYPSTLTLDIGDYAEALGGNEAEVDNEVEAEWEIDLANYPEYFVTNGEFNGFFVVGENAPAVDNLAMTDIATSMKLNGESVVVVDAVMLDVEIDEVTAQNLVIIGKACHFDDNTDDKIIHNQLTNRLLGYPEDCNVGLSDTQSIVELVEHGNGNIAMLVYGQNSADTRLAAKVIANNPEMLTGKKMLIEGTMWDDVRITNIEE